MGIPQVIMIGCLAFQVVAAGVLNGQRRGQYNAGVAAADVAITAGLLTWGGFWS